MSRVVSDVISFYDGDHNEIRSIIISKLGLSAENLKFMMDFFINKDINETIKDFILYALFIGNVDLDELEKYIDNYQDFMVKFMLLYSDISQKYPHKLQRIQEKLTEKKLFLLKGYKVDVQDSFIDYKYENIEFDSNITSEPFFQSYPLIPEYTERMYNICKNIEKIESIDCKLALLHGAVIYFNLMFERYNKEDYKIKAREIENMIMTYRSENIKFDNYLANNMNYKIYKEINPATDIDMFAEYFVKELIRNKKIDLIEVLKDILIQSDTDNPNYEHICDCIAGMLSSYGFYDEYYCFLDMRKEQTDAYIVCSFITYFYTLYSSDECQKLIDDSNGNERTHE